MRTTQLGADGPDVPVLGLGCSHIASLSTRASGPEIAALLDRAYELGLRVFDTADIYGQGDSERRLSRIAGQDGVVICTKAGLALSVAQSLIGLVKPLLRPALQRLEGAKSRAGRMRQKAEISDLDPATLERRLEGSLRRLKRDQVDMFLLHSPPISTLEDGALYDLLDRLRERQLARITGVSCRSLEDAQRVLSDGRAQAIQIPLDAETLVAAGPVLDMARAAGVHVIAREVLRPRPRLGLDGALRPVLDDTRVDVVLCGTTSADHLAKNVAIARAG